MVTHRQKTSAFVILALLAATLACNTFTSANPIVATAQSMATQADELGDLAATAQALATNVDLGDMAATAEALATDANLGDLAVTAQALATTAFSGELPPDIPLPDAQTENLFTMENIVSYSTPMAFADIVAFYKDAMVQNGWELNPSATFETQDASILSYTRSDRDVILTISVDTTTKATFVQIIVTPK